MKQNKFILLFILTFSFLFAESFSYLKPSQKDINKIKNNFEYLKKQKQNIDIKVKQKSAQDNILFLKQKLNSFNPEKVVSEDNRIFIEKNESTQLKKFLNKEIKKLLKTKNKQLVLFYFMSSSVPKDTVANFLIDSQILKDIGLRIRPTLFLIGPPDNFKNYMLSWQEYIDNYNSSFQKIVAQNFLLKINPYFFKALNIKAVPAIGIGICNGEGDYFGFRDCKIKYLARGDISLEYFLHLLSTKDSQYKKLYQKFISYKFRNKKELKNLLKKETNKDSFLLKRFLKTTSQLKNEGN